MELLLNTSNPLMILAITIIIALVIFVSRKSEMTWPLIIAMVAIIGCLIYHTVSIDDLQKGSEEISTLYHCIACDLIFLLTPESLSKCSLRVIYNIFFINFPQTSHAYKLYLILFLNQRSFY